MIEGLRQPTEPADAGSVAMSEAAPVAGSVAPARLPGELEQWMTRLTETDGTGLPAAELVDVLDALERAKAACAAAQAKVTAAFIDAQAAQAEQWREQMQACLDGSDFDGYCAAKEQVRRHQFTPPGNGNGLGHGDGEERRLSRRARRGAHDKAGVAAQVGLARRESPHRGARLAATALALVNDLPHTLDALAAGELSERRAELVARLTSHLSAEQQALVDAEAIGAHRPDPTDPSGRNGIAGWGDRQLEATVRAVADRIDAAAAVARARTAESARRVTIRPIPDTMALVTAVLPVKQAVAVYAALTAAAASAQAAGDERSRGQLMADALADRIIGAATATGATTSGGTTSGSTTNGSATNGSATGTSCPAGEVPIEVQIVITDRALFAGDDTPAHIPGYGPVPAGWARALLTRDLQPDSTRPDDTSPNARRGEDWRPDDTNGDDTNGDDTNGDDTSPDATRADTSGSPPTHVPARSIGSAGSPPPAKVWFRRLYTHPANGTLIAMDSRRRLFPAGLRRYLIARDGVCRTPWCEAPIRHADHVQPHAEGGPTSAGNGQGLCVRCNLVKEQPGWRVHVLQPGPQAAPAASAAAATPHALARNILAAEDPPPHTVVITTPTGHAHTSVAPPVLPGHREPDRAVRAEPVRLLPSPPSPLERLLTARLAS